VLWERNPNSDGDGPLVFDLRIVKLDNEDVGLALANIQAAPSTEFGTAQVVFRSPGSYVLVAASGPDNTRIGQSDQVNAFEVQTTSIPASISQTVLSGATSSDTLNSTAKKNLGAIIGGTLGGVAFLSLFAALGMVLLRDQPPENRRWTFYRDKMVLPPVLDIRRMSGSSSMDSRFSSLEDIEQQGLPHNDNDILSTFPIVMVASPSRPAMAYPRPRSLVPERPKPLRPLPSSPQPDEEENIMVQMEQIRNLMISLLERNSQILLNDLRR